MTPLRGSVILTPVAVIRVTIWSRDSVGKAACSTAAVPATCGEACEVPAIWMPDAVMNAPGASMVRNNALLEKQGILSGPLVLSVHPEFQVNGPFQVVSYTAPTDTTPGVQAGLDMPSVKALLPDEATARIPALRAFAIGVTYGLVTLEEHGTV